MRTVRAGLVVIVTGGALWLNLWNNDFPLGYHYDEPKKVRFIATSQQDFQHPILMLDIARAANAVAGQSEPQAIARLGRATTAVAGAAAVLALFLLARQALGFWGAVLAAALMGAMPTIAIHAHYLKEDILLVCTGLLALGAAGVYAANPTAKNAALAGVALGAAFSSHYKALLLLTAIVPVLWLMPSEFRRRYGATAWLAALVCVTTFLVLNFPLFRDPATFIAGARYSERHAMVGHFVPIYWYHYAGGYHFLHSLLPGMTAVVGIAAAGALLWYTPRVRSLSPLERMLVVYGWMSYVVPEVSPLKPPPDDARYVLPVVPVLCYFLAKGVVDLRTYFLRYKERWTPLLPVALAVLAVGWPLSATLRLVDAVSDDTRAQASARVEGAGFRAVYEVMASASLEPGAQPWGYAIDVSKLRAAGYTHFVASSFAYDMYLRGATLSDQPPRVGRAARAYHELFRYPFDEIRPRYQTFAFANPVIRIVDISDATAGRDTRAGR